MFCHPARETSRQTGFVLLCFLPYTHQMAIVTVHKGLRSPDRGQWHLMWFSSPSSLWRLVLPPLVTITGPYELPYEAIVITADGWGPCSSFEMSASLFQIKVHWISATVTTVNSDSRTVAARFHQLRLHIEFIQYFRSACVELSFSLLFIYPVYSLHC